LVFLFVLIISFLIPRSWEVERKFALIATLYLIFSIWAILDQVYFMAGGNQPSALIGYLSGKNHPLRWLYGILLIPISLSVFLPAVTTLFNYDKIKRPVAKLIEGISTLSLLYIMLDMIGIVVVVVRNFS